MTARAQSSMCLYGCRLAGVLRVQLMGFGFEFSSMVGKNSSPVATLLLLILLTVHIKFMLYPFRVWFQSFLGLILLVLFASPVTCDRISQKRLDGVLLFIPRRRFAIMFKSLQLCVGEETWVGFGHPSVTMSFQILWHVNFFSSFPRHEELSSRFCVHHNPLLIRTVCFLVVLD